MKASNILILALAVTLFVACSKKKDGGGTGNQYQNRYGYTPNDINGNRGYPNPGYPNQGMPGYQLPQNGCNGPSQMFSNLMSYCSWLASDGERTCNPNIVRQNFLQYCQGISTPNNYCQTQIRTGCFYTSGGCSFGTGSRIRSSSFSYSRSRRHFNDDGKPSSTTPIVVTPAPVKPQPPVVIHPPHEEQPAPIDCHPTPEVDCKKLKPKKPELICKLQGDANLTKNYVYSYEDYLANVKLDCGSTRSSDDIYTNNNTSNDVTTIDTTVVNAPARVETAVVRTETAAPTVVAAATPVQAKVEVAQECINLQKLNAYISNIDNNLSSSAEYYRVELLEANHSNEYIAAWKTFLKPTLDKYSLSASFRGNKGRDGKTSSLTALGANIAQNSKAVSLFENLGAIWSCDSRSMDLRFRLLANGDTGLLTGSYVWNGFGWIGQGTDSDFELIETIIGQFKHGNETGKYILSRYIGLGKNLSESQIQAKVLADMKKKGFQTIN